MWRAEFDPRAGVIYISATIWGPLGGRECKLQFDTGSPLSVLDSGIADELGYSARMGHDFSTLAGIGGVQEGYVLELTRLDVMGLQVAGHAVLCHDLDARFGIDGLVGMDLIENRIVKLDGRAGWIEVE